MAPTSIDERREVAERMRGITPIELFGYESLCDGICSAVARCIGFDEKPNSVGDFIDRLADLIDPTCKMVVKNGHACCGRCGHRLADEWEVEEDLYEFRPYCPDCGCRVVTRDGHE